MAKSVCSAEAPVCSIFLRNRSMAELALLEQRHLKGAGLVEEILKVGNPNQLYLRTVPNICYLGRSRHTDIVSGHSIRTSKDHTCRSVSDMCAATVTVDFATTWSLVPRLRWTILNEFLPDTMSVPSSSTDSLGGIDVLLGLGRSFPPLTLPASSLTVSLLFSFKS